MHTRINDLLSRLPDELAAGGIPDPLSAQFTLAPLGPDLGRLAGEEPVSATSRIRGAIGRVRAG